MLFLLALFEIVEACLQSQVTEPCEARFLDQNLDMAAVFWRRSVRISHPDCFATVTTRNDADKKNPLKFTCTGSFESQNLSCSNEPNHGHVSFRFDCLVSTMRENI